MSGNAILDENISQDNVTYQKRPFHQRRIKIALGMLREAFNASAADQKPRGIELGAATGEVAARIRAMGADIIACDGSEKDLAVARDKYGLATAKFDVEQRFPFENASLDFVYAGELIEHVFNVRHFLAECNRVLKPEGALVMTTPNLATLRDRFRFLAGRSPRQVDPLDQHRWLHIRPFTAEMLKKCLQEYGFGDTSLRSGSVEIPLPGGNPVDSKVEWLVKRFPNLGETLITLKGCGSQFHSKWLAKLFPELGASLITASHKKAPPSAPAV